MPCWADCNGLDGRPVRHDAAFGHFGGNGIRVRSTHTATGWRLRISFLRNTRGFIERGDKKIDDSVADSLLLRGDVRRRAERCASGDVRCPHQPAAMFVQFSDEEKLAPQAELAVELDGKGGIEPADGRYL